MRPQTEPHAMATAPMATRAVRWKGCICRNDITLIHVRAQSAIDFRTSGENMNCVDLENFWERACGKFLRGVAIAKQARYQRLGPPFLFPASTACGCPQAPRPRGDARLGKTLWVPSNHPGHPPGHPPRHVAGSFRWHNRSVTDTLLSWPISMNLCIYWNYILI